MYAKDIDINSYSTTIKLKLVKPNPKYASITITLVVYDKILAY